jgi:hypothetical protein
MNAHIAAVVRAIRDRSSRVLPYCKSVVRPFGNVFPTLFSVAFGFCLAVSWDLWKTHRDQRDELFRAARAVHQELAADLEAIKSNLIYLDKDIAASQAHEEVVQPMSNLVTVAGDTAYLKGSFEYKSIDLSMKLRSLYSTISTTNKRIEQRDLYRMTNAAMSNFSTRRKIWDEIIRADFVSQQDAISKFIVALKEAHLVE